MSCTLNTSWTSKPAVPGKELSQKNQLIQSLPKVQENWAEVSQPASPAPEVRERVYEVSPDIHLCTSMHSKIHEPLSSCVGVLVHVRSLSKVSFVTATIVSTSSSAEPTDKSGPAAPPNGWTIGR
jgi:hypothetical protein